MLTFWSLQTHSYSFPVLMYCKQFSVTHTLFFAWFTLIDSARSGSVIGKSGRAAIFSPSVFMRSQAVTIHMFGFTPAKPVVITVD